MSHNNEAYIADGLRAKCQRLTEQCLQLQRQSASFQVEVASLKADTERQLVAIAEYDEENASLKEENAALKRNRREKFLESIDARNSITDLTQQLAAANGRLERMREALEIAYDHLLVHWTEEQLKTVVPLHKIPAALSDLHEADKEKS